MDKSTENRHEWWSSTMDGGNVGAALHISQSSVELITTSHHRGNTSRKEQMRNHFGQHFSIFHCYDKQKEDFIFLLNYWSYVAGCGDYEWHEREIGIEKILTTIRSIFSSYKSTQSRFLQVLHSDKWFEYQLMVSFTILSWYHDNNS